MYLIHFVVSLLSQLNISWAWLINAPMPQPLSVFDCVVKAKFMLFPLHEYRDVMVLKIRHHFQNVFYSHDNEKAEV